MSTSATAFFISVYLLASVPIVAAERYGEAPMLRDRVEAGELPPVQARLPEEPVVVDIGGKIGQYGGQLRVMSTNVAEMFEVSLLVADPVLRFNRDGKTLEPNIARHWEMSDDGKSITIYLRKGMRWSDGAPLTVDDFFFAYYDVLRNESITPLFPGKYTAGDVPMEMERIDDYTFRYLFAEPYGAFPYFLTQALTGGQVASLVMPKHYLKHFHSKYTPEDQLMAKAKEKGFDHWFELFIELFTRHDIAPYTPPDFPVLGAWHVSSVPTMGLVFIERNPYYWKVDREGNQLPYIDSIRSTYVQNLEAQNMELISGNLDLGALQGTFDYAPLFMSHREKGNYRVYFYECNWGARVTLYLNQTHRDPVMRKIFQNRDFRIALSLGINREELNQILYFGKCRPQQLTVNPACSYYRSEFTESYAEYDPERANQILDEIGLRRERPGGWRLRPDGKVLAMFCGVLEGGFRPQTIELIKAYWADLGIVVGMRVVDPNYWRTRWRGNLQDVNIFPDDVATDVRVLEVLVYGIQNWAPLWRNYFETNGKMTEFLFQMELGAEQQLQDSVVSDRLRRAISDHDNDSLSDPITIKVEEQDRRWAIMDERSHYVVEKEDSALKISKAPPPHIMRLYEIWREMVRTTDETKRVELGTELIRSQAENLWGLGTVGEIVRPIIVHNRLHNVPEQGLWGYPWRATSLHHPEQFFLDSQDGNSKP